MQKKITARFYHTESGTSPVLEWLRSLPVIFCAEEGELFVLHGFIKKTQKTPAVDLSLAYKRMKEIKS